MDKMLIEEGLAPGHQKASPRRFWRTFLISIVVGIGVLSLAALFIPTLDGPNSRRIAREAAAVGSLYRITALQNDYAAAHPAMGFACQLPSLKPSSYAKDDTQLDELLSGDYAGYKISLTGCAPEPGGVVTQYRVTAVPLEPEKSDVRAFCADQTGVLWYDADGSAEKCLSVRRKIN
jgi:hypothetical protein